MPLHRLEAAPTLSAPQHPDIPPAPPGGHGRDPQRWGGGHGTVEQGMGTLSPKHPPGGLHGFMRLR